jgi:hypothetical protein
LIKGLVSVDIDVLCPLAANLIKLNLSNIKVVGKDTGKKLMENLRELPALKYLTLQNVYGLGSLVLENQSDFLP